MKSAATFAIALAIAVVGLVLLKKTAWGSSAWLYVAILLMGIAVYNRAGINTTLADLESKMRGG